MPFRLIALPTSSFVRGPLHSLIASRTSETSRLRAEVERGRRASSSRTSDGLGELVFGVFQCLMKEMEQKKQRKNPSGEVSGGFVKILFSEGGPRAQPAQFTPSEV